MPPRLGRLPSMGVLLLAAALSARAACAATSATLRGAVRDAQGRPIALASVTLSGNGVRTIRNETDDEGRYRFPGLAPDTTYSLLAEQSAYRAVEYDGLLLQPARTRVVDFRLKRPGERDVVILASRDPFPYQDLARAFMSQLEVPVRLLELDGDPDPDGTVRRVLAERPNLILCAGLRAARLVRREVREIPSIVTLVSDPRRYDLEAPNLCFESNNPSPEDLLQHLTAILPRARRLGVVYDAEASTMVARDIRGAAERRGLEVEMRPCYKARDLAKALDSMAGRIDVLMVPFDPLTSVPAALDAVTGWALRHRVPLAAPGPEWVRRGALFSYGATLEGLGADAAWIASQVLFQGRQPSDFGLSNPRRPTLAVNEGTAQALGVSIPAEFIVDLRF